MGEKTFILNPKIEHLEKYVVDQIATDSMAASAKIWQERENEIAKAMQDECALKHVNGRIIVRVNKQAKNYHTFSNGVTIRRERQYNEFNRRITQPVNAIVMSAETIPTNAEILINHNALHDTNKIFDYKSSSPDVEYFSLPEYECYAWKYLEEDYSPLPNFEFGLRVYEPYQGNLIGIQPKFLKDVLYVTTGDLRGKIIRTVKAADYEIIYQNDDGREAKIIRFRHSDNPDFDREEVIGIDTHLSDLYQKGQLLVGYSPNDAKTC